MRGEDIMKRHRYPTDLTDTEWASIEPLLPPCARRGRPRTTDMRDILDAIFYVLQSGIPWRMLPHDFPPWKTVYHYFRIWQIDGSWEMMSSAVTKRGREQSLGMLAMAGNSR